MSKRTLKVRAPHFPLYSEVRHLIRIFEGVSQTTIKAMVKAISEQAGTPRKPVDWSRPDSWIRKRLSGDSAILANRIWQESEQQINPRYIYGSYLFINSSGLLEDNVFGVYQISPRGQAFLENDPKILRELDDNEGLPQLLGILAGKSAARRRDILPEWRDFLREHSRFGTLATIRDTLRRRLRNLVERDYVSKVGVTYAITKKGLDYTEQFTKSDLDQKRDVIRVIKAYNKEQDEALRSRLSAMHEHVFEFLVQEFLESMGYEEIKVTKESGDKGVEVIARVQLGINTVNEVVHVKRHQATTGRPALDRLRSSIAQHSAIRATLVSLGRFTKECKEAAIEKNAVPVTLIDGRHFLRLLTEYQIGITSQAVSLNHLDEDYFSRSENSP
jgi:restriction system protein